MNGSRSRGFLIGSVIAAVACIFQIIGLFRYVERLPDDWVGLGLYLVTIIAFALVAFGFYVQSRKQ
jgi:hypothetical protein